MAATAALQITSRVSATLGLESRLCLQYAQRKDSAHSHLDLPVHLDFPEHRNRQKGEDDISQDRDTRVEESGEFEICRRDARPCRSASPRESQRLALEEDGYY